MAFRISRSQRLGAAIGLSAAFFLTEISVGFYTHSLALVADAFHYLNDLVGFIVAFVAFKASNAEHSPKELSFGWQRAQVLGAFFNGSLLFALGISIFLQSIERFITLHHVENPKLMFIIGSVGLGLNIICACFLHEHHHDHHDHHDHHRHSNAASEEIPQGQLDLEQQREVDTRAKHRNHRHLKHKDAPVFGGHDMNMVGVLLHVLGDAANNLGVMVAALVIWLTRYEARYYADPATSLGIAAMIFLSALPLIRQSGLVLLESAPNGLDPDDVKHDLQKVKFLNGAA
ncbi:cation efflux protein [Aspergillus multicolor]|uniref:putative di-, tri-valent inorganic cation transporter n=1 Tax=Aspergillus multicolor TaxID=41759 RepID=UPI003CCDEF4F